MRDRGPRRLRPGRDHSPADAHRARRADDTRHQPSTQGRQALPVVVSIDNVKVGPVSELKTRGTVDIREIRYLSPRIATDRSGLNHAGGVIHVTTIQGLGPDTTAS